LKTPDAVSGLLDLGTRIEARLDAFANVARIEERLVPV
jgi:hypothetical protein